MGQLTQELWGAAVSSQRSNYSIRFHKPSCRAYLWDGKRRIYLGAWPENPLPPSREVREAFRAAVARLALGGTEDASPTSICAMTVAELVAQFIQWAEVRYDSPSEAKRMALALRPVLSLYADQPAASFGPKRLQEVQKLLAKQGRTRQGINMACGFIRQCFAWGVSQELLKFEQLGALRSVQSLRFGAIAAPESPPREAAPLADVEATLLELSPTIAAMVRLQMLTGCRPAEVCKLSMAEIDRADSACWVYRPEHHKMAHLGRHRAVPLLSDAMELLRPFLRADGLPLFSPADAMEEWEATKRAARKSKVQPSQVDRHKEAPLKTPGQSYETASYRRAIARACQRAGVPLWSPNGLRKLAGQTVCDALGIDKARALLGHADSTITKRHYAKNDLEQSKIAAQALQKKA